MFRIIVIFALWIGWSSYHPTSGKSVAASTFLMTDFIKKTDNMTRRKTISELVRDFRKIHGNRYDYSLITVYNNNKQALPIVCSKHGVYYQSANSHLRGCGCPQCADKKNGDRCRIKFDCFLKRAKLVHGDKYDYSHVVEDGFPNSHSKIPIVCKKHGLFYQSIHDHLSGRGCYECGKESMAKKQRFTRNELVEKFNKIFNGKYDYSLFKNEDYKNKESKIPVVCPKHGVFFVSVDNHLYKHSGCPFCKRSCGEDVVAKYLEENNIEFIQQYKIPNTSLLCFNNFMLVDFYLPKHNIIIEFNGIQHYKEIDFFSERSLYEQQNRDDAVRFYCKNHGIKLIEIPYTKINNIEKILERKI